MLLFNSSCLLSSIPLFDGKLKSLKSKYFPVTMGFPCSFFFSFRELDDQGAGKEKCYLWTILLAFIAQFVRVKFARLKRKFQF